MPEYLMERSALVRELIARGWLEEQDEPSEPRLAIAVRRYQTWHGLAVSGVAGPEVERALTAPRLCGLADEMRVVSVRRWSPERAEKLKWCVSGRVSGLSSGDLKQVFAWAFELWMAACRVKLEYTASEASANVVIRGGHLEDRPRPPLSWCQVPRETSERIELVLEEREPWRFEVAPGMYRFDAGRAALHLAGHALGVCHHAPGSDGEPSVMDPVYRSDVRELRGWEIEEAVRRYGNLSDLRSPTSDLRTVAPTRVAICVTIGGVNYVGHADGLRAIEREAGRASEEG
jgi:hypothetical protein